MNCSENYILRCDIPVTEELIHITGCNISKCLHVGSTLKIRNRFSLLNIVNAGHDNYTASLLLYNCAFTCSSIGISPDGRIL